MAANRLPALPGGRRRRAAEALALLAVLGFLGAYLARHAGAVRTHPWNLAAGPLLGATALSTLSLIAFGWLWFHLVRALGGSAGLRRGLAVWFVANLARYVPGKVWQVAGLAYLARRRGLDAIHAVGASLLLQLIVLAVGVLIVLLTLPVELAALGGRGGAAALGVGAALCIIFYLSPGFDLTYARMVALLGHQRPSPIGIGTKLLLGIGTAGAWLLQGTGFWLFLTATAGSSPSLPAAIGICAIGYLAGYLAFFTPGGLGVREGVYALLLGSYLSAPVALAVAFLVRLWLTLIELILAGVTTVVARAERPGAPVGLASTRGPR